MDLEGLHSFVAVAREKSISKAALSLHVTQPTLSARVRKLEDEVGVTLLERNWGGVKLTPQGQYLLPYAIQFIKSLNNAASVFNKCNEPDFERPMEEVLSTERLRIGFEGNLAPALSRHVFNEARSHLPGMDWNVVTRSSQQLMDLLEYQVIDFAFLYGFDSRPTLRSVPLFEDEIVFLCSSRDYPHLNEDLSNVELLKDEPFLLFDNPVLVSFRHITEKIFKALYGESPKRFHIVDDVAVTAGIVAGGHGYTFISKISLGSYSTWPGIRVIPLHPNMPKVGVCMSFSEKSPHVSALNAIAAGMAAYCSSDDFRQNTLIGTV